MSFLSVAKRFAAFLACAALLGASLAQAAPGIFIYYSPTAILQGNTSLLGIQIYDADGLGISGGSISLSGFTYPSQVVNTGNIASNTCTGSTPSAPLGASTMSLIGVALAAFGNCTLQIEVTTTAAGSYLTTFPAGAFTGSTGANVSSSTSTLISTQPLVVTNKLDSGAGSLRDAITNGNSLCLGIRDVQFAIPGPGPHRIRPLTQLPALICPNFTIDGYTQSGALANSDAGGGNNAVIKIELDGSLCSGCDGLQLQATNPTVKGLAIHSFGGSGILMSSGSATVVGNYIGTDPGGTNAFGNAVAGVKNTGGYLVLGSTSPGDRNLISSNGVGVWIVVGGSATIIGNQIGGKRDGTAGNGNVGRGVYFNGVNSPGSLSGNFVRYNGAAGIAVDAGSFGRITFLGNASYANGGIGIDIRDDGPTPNDEASPPYDTDGVQNYPVATSVTHVGTDTVVSGYLKSVASSFTPYPATIQLFHNSVPGTTTEGEKLIDTFNAGLDITGIATFTRTVPGIWDNVSATALVDTCGDGCTRSSEYSPKVAVTAALTAPGAPVIGTATAGNAQATVTFAPPTSDGGSPITSYTATSSPGGITATGAASPIVVTGLANGTTYTFSVTATNAIGTGPASAPSNAVTPATVPGVPTIGAATAGNAQATVSFSPPASDGGSPITGYTVTSSPTGITATGAASPIVVTGLANGTTYTFTVTATNAVGTGAPSAPSNAVTPVAPPGTPSAPIIGTATGGNAQATVTFSPPASNGGSPITGYTVTSSPGGISASGLGSPITVTGLVNGTTYTFTVGAANSVGSGPASAPSNAVTPTAPVPSITFTPSSLTFATRPVSTTSPTQTVTVANLGPGSLAITSITVSGDFAFSSTCGASVPAGGSCTIDASFTPLASGIRNGLVTISSNASGSPHSVTLSGTGQVASAPVIQVSPTSDAFAAQEVGTQSAPELFAIVNAGNATLIFSDISVTGQGFTLQPTITGSTYTRCGAAIDPGAVCAVQITFTPPAPGSFPGVLHIAGNATNSPVDVSLVASGVITTPSRALSVPASLGFPDQPVGTQSPGHSLTITNNSANGVSLGELSADGDFSVSDTCATIAGHGTCTPLVFFRPLGVGPRTGHVTIRTLTEAQPYVVDLNGIGVVNTVPQITLSVARLGFGNTLVGVPVAAQVLVRNVGQVPVVIQGVVASGDFFVAHACGAAIAVGATCTLNVSFFPRMLGGSAGGIEIRTNAFGSPHGVQLSGVGCTIPSFARARSGQPLCGP